MKFPTEWQCLCLLLSRVGGLVESKPPHIVLIVADDLGWNDVSFHNPDMITPNIHKLATEGVILNQSYVQPVCSPTRHSIMTGYYPWKAGLQHLVIGSGQAVCSPLDMTFFPELLQKNGYKTHMVGKWHLGFCNWNCTPTYRGFDSYYGYYNSREDYFTHVQAHYLDFHDGYKVVWDKTGSYSADLYADRAEQIIQNHSRLDPLFLYLPFQSVHEPLEVPPEYEALYPDIQTPGRRTFSGMVTALDSAIGRVVEALKNRGLYEDTLFFFTPDNGGWIPYHGNNWPLRGGKITIFEGGTRVAGFVSGAGLQKKAYTYNGMMHAVDWHPTILAAAGIKADETIDGINQWDEISQGGESKRTELVYNIDDVVPAVQGHAAIRVRDYKLIAGYPGHDQGWYPPDKFYGNYEDPEDWFRAADIEADVLAFNKRVQMGNESYYKLFNLKGKSVGIISTTRITHATPAALYAHSPERDWESDVNMENVTGGCLDIAKQLVEDNFYIDVVLGGGRVKFLRKNDTDPDESQPDDLKKDGRLDGRNLIEEWKTKQEEALKSHQYVSTLSELKSVDPAQIDKLLGLFSYSHMQYDIDRDKSNDGEPSIEEMTEKAIQILQKNPNGFFLMVEGGRIDQAHHLSQAKKSLYDTLAFDRAVTKATEMTSESDTLIITTADHSHVFTIAGYPKRGNPIFGLVMENGAEVEEMAADNKPYATLQYSNGPGANFVIPTMVRPNLTGIDTEDKEFLQQAGIPRGSETHGGEDVAIYARGPMAHLFHGVHEQHYIAHVMAYASCVGSYSTRDSCAQAEVDQINGGTRMSSMLNKLVAFWIALILSGFVL